MINTEGLFTDLDHDLGFELLEEFDSLLHKSKELIFTALFKCYDNAEAIISYFGSTGFLYNKCQSPIEEILAVAYDIRVACAGFPYFEVFALKPQEKIIADGNTYYADFLINAESSEYFECGESYKLIIECDGHEFHEKTKEQVEKRNKRDLDLKNEGYDILHFSGSQIYRNPNECANQIFDYVIKKVKFVKCIGG